MLSGSRTGAEGMSKGTDKSKGAPVPPEEPDDGDLATSEDLFGHLVDAPAPPVPGRGQARRDPVRVQLTDPVSPEPLAPAESHLDEEGLEPPHSPVRESAAFRPAGPMEDDEEARLPSALPSRPGPS